MSSFETLVVILASSVCTAALTATTLTDSVTAPAFIVTSMRAVPPAASLMPSTCADWKPCSVASIR